MVLRKKQKNKLSESKMSSQLGHPWLGMQPCIADGLLGFYECVAVHVALNGWTSCFKMYILLLCRDGEANKSDNDFNWKDSLLLILRGGGACHTTWGYLGKHKGQVGDRVLNGPESLFLFPQERQDRVRGLGLSSFNNFSRITVVWHLALGWGSQGDSRPECESLIVEGT